MNERRPYPEGPPAQTPEGRLAAARAWAVSGGAQPTGEAPGEGPGPILAAAERAAASIRADAEAQATRELERAQLRSEELAAERLRTIAKLTEGLIEQAAVVREHSERMIATLDRAEAELAAELERGIAPGPEDPESAAEADPGAITSEALLLATELAIAGQDREAIAARLRAALGVDPEPTLSRLLD